ncbi:MAG: ABC transporter permease [Rhodothermales bacterium]|nr:ABC transporter permease [Rhodothermales bacterium]MBO6778234.1 ABC transporter permease [Rhodothermales bacterium]
MPSLLPNYLKTAVRSLRRGRIYTGINILGLGLGIGCCLLIALFLQYELSFDRHHSNADRIFRVVSERQVGDSVESMSNAPFPTGPTLSANFPEIEEVARLFRATNGASVRYADGLYTEPRFYFTDASVFDVFTIPFRAGDPASALRAPNGVVITERAALRYFRGADPIDKTIKATLLGRTGDLVVTGVVETPPAQSHFDFDFLVPFDSELNGWNQGPPRWETGMLGAWTYVLLPDKRAALSLESKLAAFVDNHAPIAMHGSLAFSLQHLPDIHLRSHRIDELGANGSMMYLYVFAGVALLILLIACINFVNVTTAQSFRRVREVGVRKALGAGRGQLVRQYLSESLVLSFGAVLVALALVALTLPYFRSAIGIPLFLDVLANPSILVFLGGVWLVTGVLSGLYPAFVISRFSPVKAVKGTVSMGRARLLSLRTALSVGQFAASAILLVILLNILNQLDYIEHRELGFEQDQLLVLTGSGASFDVLKRELTASPSVTSVTVTSRVPAGRHLARRSVVPQGVDRENVQNVPFLRVEQDFVSTLQMRVTEGRDFVAGDQQAILVNEAAVRAFGWTDGAIAKQVTELDRGSERVWNVVGVIENSHFESLHASVEPLILAGGINSGSRVIARISPHDISGAIDHIQTTWARLSPETPASFYFMDENIDAMYVQERRLRNVLQGFAALAIFISCIGLFGVVALSTQQRRKEVGIRKALGATATDIVMLLSQQYVALVACAMLVAAPVAYIVADRWLAGFAYNTGVSGLSFLIAAGSVLLLALGTTAWQSLGAARVAPVESLRND